MYDTKKVLKNILGDRYSKSKISETRKENIIKLLKRHMPNLSDSDADSMANGLLSGKIPFIDTGIGRIEIK